jgi:enterochelin esterase family protein
VFLLPGEEVAFAATPSLPHGEVRIVWHDSTAVGSPRSMRICTPPGYDGSGEAYPVLYLIHSGVTTEIGEQSTNGQGRHG